MDGNEFNNSTIINAIEKLDKKIDKIEEKLEKLRDKVLNPKIFLSGITIIISTIGWLVISTTDISKDVVEHGVLININKNKISEIDEKIVTNYMYNDEMKKSKITKAQYQIVKNFLDVKRREQIPLKVYLLYDLMFDDIETATMFVLRKMDEL